MTTYIFEPLMQDGKQVVRQPKEGEWYRGKTFDQPIMCHGLALAEENRPILTLKVIDSKAIEGIREVWTSYKDDVDAIKKMGCIEYRMIKAISAFIKEVDK